MFNTASNKFQGLVKYKRNAGTLSICNFHYDWAHRNKNGTIRVLCFAFLISSFIDRLFGDSSVRVEFRQFKSGPNVRLVDS